ncbi:hypothetical protein, partial [Escherichia coli]|uniref:hypothetical protein n=1 Tax=Escherichia coli TaxID=562 RepID=UPI001BC88322
VVREAMDYTLFRALHSGFRAMRSDLDKQQARLTKNIVVREAMDYTLFRALHSGFRAMRSDLDKQQARLT